MRIRKIFSILLIISLAFTAAPSLAVPQKGAGSTSKKTPVKTVKPLPSGRNSSIINPVLVYFHNRKYTGPLVNIYGEWYAPVERIAVLLKVILEHSGNKYFITTRGEDSIKPVKKLDAVVYINGRPFKNGVVIQGERVLVSLRLFAEAVKFAYIYNTDTQIIDIVQATSLPPGYIEEHAVATLPPSSNTSSNAGQNTKQQDKKVPVTVDAASGDGKDANVTKTNEGTLNALDGSERNSIVFESPNFYQEPFATTGEVRYSGVIRNRSDKHVESVIVTCQFLDPEGKLLNSQTKELGTLLAGATKDVLFSWVNASGLNVMAQMRLDWAGKSQK